MTSSTRRARGWRLVGLALLIAATASVEVASQEPAHERVLFIGNSLTTTHDVPALVRALADAAGGPAIDTATLAVNNFSLEDHWNRGDAQRLIARGDWTWVVLQQGPSALPESQRLLREFSRRFDQHSRKAGVRTALYMVWPSRARAFDFRDVSESYAAAARSIGGRLLPVGDAWREAWAIAPSLKLYGPDAFHPSPEGAMLAALVIYQGLSGRTAQTVPAGQTMGTGHRKATIDPNRAGILLEAARRVGR